MTVSILDCTLRDGSYPISFRFTPRQTRVISAGLASAGISRIEVGHGVGIGASARLQPALVSDLDYALAAAEGAPDLWGMFAIPSIANLSDLPPLVEAKMRFIRVGVESNRIVEGTTFVQNIAKKFPGLEIFVNFMKSYQVSPRGFAKMAKRFEDLPVAGVYLVDSAGGMTPTSVADYGSTLRESCEFGYYGFHGHNNLGLAVANCLTLQKSGFNLFDATLQGLGRSSGNTMLEQLIALFHKIKIPMREEINFHSLLRLGDREVRHLIPKAGFSFLDTAAGRYDFHSSHFEDLMRVAVSGRIDPLVLLEEVARAKKPTNFQQIRTVAQNLPAADDDLVLGSLDYYSNADSGSS